MNTYRIAMPSVRKHIAIQQRDIGLENGKVVTGPPLDIRDLRVYEVRFMVRLARKEFRRGSILLLTEKAASRMVASGAIHEVELLDFPEPEHDRPEAGTRTAET